MKTFFKCTISALAVSAIVVLVFLSGGCNKNLNNPSGDSLLGTWSIEFEEEEMGGSCVGEYTFMEGGEAIFTFTSAEEGEESMPMLWRTEGNKLYFVDKEYKDLYDENGIEWDSVIFEVAGNQLNFYDDGEVVASFSRKQ